jgi:hypothetical protein
MAPLAFPTISFVLPLSPQNPLDHVSAFIKPWKLYFEDLDLHGPPTISPSSVNQSGPWTSSAANKGFTSPWDNFMIHSVNCP